MSKQAEINKLRIMLRQARPAVLAAAANKMTVGGQRMPWSALAEKIDNELEISTA